MNSYKTSSIVTPSTSSVGGTYLRRSSASASSVTKVAPPVPLLFEVENDIKELGAKTYSQKKELQKLHKVENAKMQELFEVSRE